MNENLKDDPIIINSEDDGENKYLIDHKKNLKKDFRNTIGAIAIETAKSIEKDIDNSFIYCLSEIVYSFAEKLASDAEKFAKHRKKNLINPEDILLFCRNNPQLLELLEKRLDEYNKEKEEKKTHKTKNTEIKKSKQKKIKLYHESESDLSDFY